MIKLNIINEDASSSTIFYIDGGGYDDILAELSNRPTNGMYKLKSICFGGPSSERCISVDYISKETANEVRTHINDQENAFDGCGLDSLWSEADDIQNAKSYYDDDMWKAIASVKDIRDFVVNAVQDGYGEFFESEFDDFVSNIEDGDKKSINVAKKVADVLGLDVSDVLQSKAVKVSDRDKQLRAEQDSQMKDIMHNLLANGKIESDRRNIKSLYKYLIRDDAVTKDKVKRASKIAKALRNLYSKMYDSIDWLRHLPGLHLDLDRFFNNDLNFCEELIEDLSDVDYDEVVYDNGKEVKEADWLWGKLMNTFNEIFKYLESIGYTIR